MLLFPAEAVKIFTKYDSKKLPYSLKKINLMRLYEFPVIVITRGNSLCNCGINLTPTFYWSPCS